MKVLSSAPRVCFIPVGTGDERQLRKHWHYTTLQEPGRSYIRAARMKGNDIVEDPQWFEFIDWHTTAMPVTDKVKRSKLTKFVKDIQKARWRMVRSKAD